jgi:DNA modification methylase
MKRMNDCFIDLTITSPPYDNLREYNGFDFDFESIAKELYRVTKDGGVVVWIVGDATINGSETGTSFKQALYFKEIGFNLHDTMIYQKNSPPLTHKRYEQNFEYMFILCKGKIKTFNPIYRKKIYKDTRIVTQNRREKNGEFSKGFRSKSKETIKGNIWKYSVGGGISSNDKISFLHPAIFPEQLVKEHIYSWSNEGDLIYDCFMGSGTTAKMAHLQKRNWIGSEISKEYTELANKRIKKYINQTSLF